MIELTARQYLIIKLLKEYSKPILGLELSNLLHVSTRTLRYEIKNINAIFKVEIITSNKNGYSLSRHKQATEMLSSLKINDAEQLSKMIILTLLEHPEVFISDLSEEHYISDSTTYNIIKKIQPKMHDFNLKIQRQGEKLKLLGAEYDKRRLLTHFFLGEANSLTTTLAGFNDYFTNFDLSEVQNIIQSTLMNKDIVVEDIYLKNIVISFAICLQRIIDGHHIDDVPGYLDLEKNELQVEVTKEICSLITEKIGVPIEGKDFENILFFTTGSLKTTSSKRNIENEEIFRKRVLDVLEQTECKFQIALNNEDFVDSFILHIHFLILRAKSANFFLNDVSTSLRLSHPFVYEAAVYLAYLLEKEFKINIADDEIGLIAIYLGSLATNIQSYPKPKIACVCSSYHELKKMMVQQLTNEYGSKIEIAKVVSTFSEIDEEVDLIISSVSHSENLANSIQVSPIITPIEMRKIEKALLEFIKKQKKDYFREHLLRFFDKELFFYNLGLENGLDILDFFDKKLRELDVIDNTFIDDVHKRELLSSTAFFNKFALPHSLNALSKKTKVVYYYSEKAVNWFDNRAHLIILLATSEYSSQTADIYSLLFDVLIDENLYKKLILCKTVDELVEFLENNA